MVDICKGKCGRKYREYNSVKNYIYLYICVYIFERNFMRFKLPQKA